MFREKLDRLAAAALDFLMRALAALWTMAVRNPRTTAGGIVAALAFVATSYGLELTPDEQQTLALGIIIFIGLVAGDHHLRKGIR